GSLFLLGSDLLSHLFLTLQQSGRRFFSSFTAGLIVGVDVNQRAVKAHCPLVQRDQCSEITRVHLENANRDGFAPTLVERASRPAQKPLKIIAACDAVLNFEPLTAPIFAHFDERDEKIQDAVAQLLNISVLIGRAFVAVNSNTLVHSLAIEVLFFA